MKPLFVLLLLSLGIGACYFYFHKPIIKNSPEITRRYADQLLSDPFPLAGEFRWTFFLGPVEQVSTHYFTAEYINYRMRGKIHSTDYRMTMLSYDAKTKKWIGETPDGVVYVIFFKAVGDQHVTLYKHKCTKGLLEAMTLTRPADDATTDHGWNIYTRANVSEKADELPFNGTFYANQKQAFQLHDNSAMWQSITYHKLSHHFGERRWVGQNGERYLVIFYRYEKGAAQGSFAIHIVDDIEKAYRLKHEQQTFTLYHLK